MALPRYSCATGFSKFLLQRDSEIGQLSRDGRIPNNAVERARLIVHFGDMCSVVGDSDPGLGIRQRLGNLEMGSAKDRACRR